MRELEQIRKNLSDATASLRRMGPYVPKRLIQEVEAAWVRFQRINQHFQGIRQRNNFGQIILISIAAAAGLSAIFGGSWLISKELNESDRLKKLSKCVEDATKTGLSLNQAQQTCNKLYGKGDGSLINIGGLGISTTTLLIIGAVFIGGLILYKKL